MYDCTNKKPERNNHLLQEEDNQFSFYINDLRTAMIRVDFQVYLSQLLQKPSRWSTSASSAVRTISRSLLLLAKSSVHERGAPSIYFYSRWALWTTLCAPFSSLASTVSIQCIYLATCSSLLSSQSHVSWRPSQPSLSELSIHVAQSGLHSWHHCARCLWLK